MSVLPHQTQVNPGRNFWDTSEQANSGIALVYSISNQSGTYSAGASTPVVSVSYTPTSNGRVMAYGVVNLNNTSIFQFDATASINFNSSSACVSATQLPAKAVVTDATITKCLSLVGVSPVVAGTTYTITFAFSNSASAGSEAWSAGGLMLLFSP